jgi:predicted phage terminase large subunit-like protein
MNNELEKVLLKKALEDNFLRYAQYIFKKNTQTVLQTPYPIQQIAKALQDVYEGKEKRLIINIFPGVGKTTIIKLFMSWCIAKQRQSNFIYTSYSDALTLKTSTETRDIVKSEAFQDIWGVGIRQDTDSKRIWSTEEGGNFYAVSMGGSVTGFNAGRPESGFQGMLCLDDPLKASDVRSQVYLERSIDYFNNTLLSRLRNPKETPIVIIMQRLHLDDLTGYLMKTQADDWTLLKLPAILNYGQDNEQSLWEDKFDLPMLHKMEKLNPGLFWGQYMQEPYVQGGGVIKTEYFKYYSMLPHIDYKIITGDTAQKTGQSNDYSVFQCWGYGKDKNYYLIDMIRGKWESPELKTQLVAFWNKHNNNGRVRSIYVEDKVSGTGLIQSIKREDKLPIQGIKVDKDKLSRVNDILPIIASGYVYLNKDAPYLSDLLSECEAFSDNNTHKHDDIVDTIAHALKVMTEKSEPVLYVV